MQAISDHQELLRITLRGRARGSEMRRSHGTECKEPSSPKEHQLSGASWWCAPRKDRGTVACGTRKREKETRNQT